MKATAGEIKRRRKYSLTFKRESVEHWLASGKSAEESAAALGLTADLLYRWKAQLGWGEPGASTAQLEAQLVVLRRENEALRQQRDILKKTLGILSEPSSSGINASKP